jgi:hypothetical protein
MTLIECLIEYFKPLYDADGEMTAYGVKYRPNKAGIVLIWLENESEYDALFKAEEYFDNLDHVGGTEMQFMVEINERICEILDK